MGTGTNIDARLLIHAKRNGLLGSLARSRTLAAGGNRPFAFRNNFYERGGGGGGGVVLPGQRREIK